MKRLILSMFLMTLLTSYLSASTFQKLDGCIVYFTEEAGYFSGSQYKTGDGITNLKKITDLSIKSNGIKLFVGKATISLYADKTDVTKIVDTFIKCAK